MADQNVKGCTKTELRWFPISRQYYVVKGRKRFNQTAPKRVKDIQVAARFLQGMRNDFGVEHPSGIILPQPQAEKKRR